MVLKDDSPEIKKGNIKGITVGFLSGFAGGGGIGADLVVAPILGASGPFIVAGVAFPPILVVCGTALIVGGLSVGLERLISNAVQKSNPKLLDLVGEPLRAFMKCVEFTSTWIRHFHRSPMLYHW